jgi:hypothetical protein
MFILYRNEFDVQDTCNTEEEAIEWCKKEIEEHVNHPWYYPGFEVTVGYAKTIATFSSEEN